MVRFSQLAEKNVHPEQRTGTLEGPMTKLVEFSPGHSGWELSARMTVVRLSNGDLFVHSPSDLDNDLGNELNLWVKFLTSCYWEISRLSRRVFQARVSEPVNTHMSRS